MSLLGTCSRSKTLSSASAKVAGCAAATAPSSYQHRRLREEEPQSREYHGNNKSRAVRWSAAEQAKTIENIFISSLVRAGSCRRCAPHIHRAEWTPRRLNLRHAQQSPYRLSTETSKRTFSSTTPTLRSAQAAGAIQLHEDDEELQLGKAISRAEYADLGNTYPSPSDLWELQRTKIKYTPPKPPVLVTKKPPPNYLPLAPRLVITPEQESRDPRYTERIILPPEDEEHARQIKQLVNYLKRPSRGKFAQRAWTLFLALRTPRPRYLNDHTLHALFTVLSRVEFKTLVGSKRYFALLDQCLSCGVPLTVSQWNNAIAFAGRWVKYTSKEEVRAAVETWMRMEDSSPSGGNAKPDNVTFNILFDVAIRAGRFALADTIHNELIARDMPLNRYFRTSMIHYAGLRASGDAVRKAFKDLVNAGEIVDTAVMNCVILGLVRSGEAPSAENVFQKMKEMHVTKFGTSGPRDWRGRRKLGARLNRTAISLREERESHTSTFFGSSSPFLSDERKEEAQRTAPIHPDFRTCQILIRYHALRSGNLTRINELISEMKDGGWNVHGSVYLDIFRGFYLFGGHAYTEWTRAALEGFWKEFLSVVRAAPVLEEGELVEGQKRPAIVDGMDVRGTSTSDSHGLFRNGQFRRTDQDDPSGIEHNGKGTDVARDADADPRIEHPLDEAYGKSYSPTPSSRSATTSKDVKPTFSSVDKDLKDLQVHEHDALEEEILDNESLAPYFTPHLAKAVIHAFYQCAGRPKMLSVFEEIRSVWGALGMSEGDREAMEGMASWVGKLGV